MSLPTLVMTTINAPEKVGEALAEGAARAGWRFVVVGDAKTPPGWERLTDHYLDLGRQRAMGSAFAEACPENSYARKAVGYLHALREGAELIVETDDDNLPCDGFWSDRNPHQELPLSANQDWVNVYRYFSDIEVWPRGFPLNKAPLNPPAFSDLPVTELDCPIQNGLADDDPDVDALYRLTEPEPLVFNQGPPVAIGPGSWCPFNSQNTTIWREAMALAYLPAFCSVRMTDIWRSFVAQRLMWEMDWHLLFHAPTVRQERNEHDLVKDLRLEMAGYLWNEALCQRLGELPLKAGHDQIGPNMRACYELMIEMDLVGAGELDLLDCWLEDITPHTT